MPICPIVFMHMTISWNGLSIPTEGCSVNLPIVITNFKARGVKQDSVLYMMKVILTHTPIECRVVNPTTTPWHAQSIPTNRHVHRTIGHIGYAQSSEHANRTS